MPSLNKFNSENTEAFKILEALETLTGTEWDFAGPALVTPCMVYHPNKLTPGQAANIDRLCAHLGISPETELLMLTPAHITALLARAQEPEAVNAATLTLHATQESPMHDHPAFDVSAHIDLLHENPVSPALGDALTTLTGATWHSFHTPSAKMTGAGFHGTLTEEQKAKLVAACEKLGALGEHFQIRPQFSDNATLVFANAAQIKLLTDLSHDVTYEEIAEAPTLSNRTVSAILAQGPKDPTVKKGAGSIER